MTGGAWAVKVYGTPAPKGSLKCIGGRGRHQLIENNERTAPWRKRVAEAGRALKIPEPLEGPIGVEIVFTIELPASVKPASRPWPIRRSKAGGDIDKLVRVVLDGLEDAGVYKDDAQVCEQHTYKVHPHTPTLYLPPEARLDRPGAFIRIYTL